MDRYNTKTHTQEHAFTQSHTTNYCNNGYRLSIDVERIFGLVLLQSFSWYIYICIYSIQIYNNSILPPGCNGGRECILACYSSFGCHMNKRRCECFSQSQYVIYQNECRPVKYVQHSLCQHDRKDRYLSERGSSFINDNRIVTPCMTHFSQLPVLWRGSNGFFFFFFFFFFLPEASFIFGYCRCLRPSIRPFIRAITHHPFNLVSPNLDQRC